MKSVEVPGVGKVNFPDEMSDEEIAAAIRRDILKQQPPQPVPANPPLEQGIAGRGFNPENVEARRTFAFQGLGMGLPDEAESAGVALRLAISNPYNDDRDVWTRAREFYEVHMENLRRERERLTQPSIMEQPLATQGEALAAEMAGGVASGGAIGRAVAGTRAAQALPGPIRGAVIGGAEGAVYGAASANPGERDRGAALGAGFAAGGGALADAMYRAGSGFVRARHSANPTNRAREILRQSAEFDNLGGPDEIARRLDDLGPQATPADLGENMAARAQSVYSRPGPTRNSAREVLDARQGGAAGRVEDSAATNMTTPPNAPASLDEYDRVIRAATDGKRADADPWYKAAYAKPTNITPEMREVLDSNNPHVKNAHQKTREILEGKWKPGDPYSTEYIGTFKEMMDDEVEQLLMGANRRPKLGRRVKAMRDTVRDGLKAQNKEYETALGLYSSHAKVLEAAEMGRGLVSRKTDPRDIVLAVQDMSEAEKNALRLGLLRGVVDRLEDGVPNASVARRILGTKRMERVLRAVFPNDASFDEFARMADAEGVFAETRRTVQSGSPTQPRTTEQNALDAAVRPGGAAAAAVQASRGDVIGSVMSLLNSLRGAGSDLSDEVIEEIGKVIFRQRMNMTDDEIRMIFQEYRPSWSATSPLRYMTPQQAARWRQLNAGAAAGAGGVAASTQEGGALDQVIQPRE